jgi:hypothetical protein
MRDELEQDTFTWQNLSAFAFLILRDYRCFDSLKHSFQCESPILRMCFCYFFLSIFFPSIESARMDVLRFKMLCISVFRFHHSRLLSVIPLSPWSDISARLSNQLFQWCTSYRHSNCCLSESQRRRKLSALTDEITTDLSIKFPGNQQILSHSVLVSIAERDTRILWAELSGEFLRQSDCPRMFPIARQCETESMPSNNWRIGTFSGPS